MAAVVVTIFGGGLETALAMTRAAFPEHFALPEHLELGNAEGTAHQGVAPQKKKRARTTRTSEGEDAWSTLVSLAYSIRSHRRREWTPGKGGEEEFLRNRESTLRSLPTISSEDVHGGAYSEEGASHTGGNSGDYGI